MSLARHVSLALVAFAGGAVTGRLADARPKDASAYALLDQLARVLVLVENEYVEPVDRRRLVEGALSGMVSALDPHSSYLPKEDYSLFQADTEGRFGGVGIEIELRADHLVVLGTMEGSPAERAGLRPGDRIVAIDAQPVRDRKLDELLRRMRGAPGTKVDLTVERDGREGSFGVALVREVIRVVSVVGKLLKGEVAYVRVRQFQEGTHDELLRVVGRLRAEAPGGRFAGVLLDLRNNGGGLVDECVAVADELLGPGVVYTARQRGKVVDEARSAAGGALGREPLVALVNEYSASAAEIVAGALQDHRRATLVGSRTFGKGSVQSIIDLPDGSGLKLTTMRYYTPNGRAIQAQGVEPDVLVPASGSAPPAVTREADLEGHLPAEGVTPPAPAATPAAAASATPGESGDVLGVPRDVPEDPTHGRDTALSVAYRVLLRVVGQRR
ncbi:MAG: S41 family peptidase [Polyangiaceae bacterium]|nr:S41 family peptidase [Polyangiaceae bacterium]